MPAPGSVALTQAPLTFVPGTAIRQALGDPFSADGELLNRGLSLSSTRAFAVTAEAYDELRARLDALAGELNELRRQDDLLCESFNHFDQQMGLASQVQRDMLPRVMPAVPGASFSALFRPVDRVSGDIYNVRRLDETRTALSLADATGHGIAAALLTVFVKQALRGKEVAGKSYRLLTPDEVLDCLNADLIETNLTEGLFVTIVYALYDHAQRRLTWSRGGAPHPVLIRSGQAPQLLPSYGPLVGALPEASFAVQTTDLRSGDTVLLYTDGLESLLLSQPAQRGQGDFLQTDWFAGLGRRPIEASLADVERLLDETPSSAWPVDDVTLLALSVE